ncbi:glycosyltransferase [Cohnella cellulosilytica]
MVPSNYPSSISPVSGVFFKEQALALAELRPSWNVSISLWNQGETTFLIKQPSNWLKILRTTLSNEKKSKNKLSDNIVEYVYPALTWSRRFLQGNVRQMLHASRINLQNAIMQSGKINIIHAHISFPAGWVAMKLSEEFNIPFVITEHMSPFPFPSYLTRDGTLNNSVRKPLQKANRVIAVSPALVQQIRRYEVSDPVYIPNLVDEDFFEPVLMEKKKKFTFFTLGNMMPQKGIPTLLHAIKMFLINLSDEDKRNVEFLIGGDGKYFSEYKILANTLGLSEFVRWMGLINREEVKGEFQNCDCFVLTSKHESFGVVYAEAIACGKPIIATKCGGPEVIVTPQNGLLTEIDDVKGISEALNHMFLNFNQYSSPIIRNQFMSKFSKRAVIDQLDELYKQVIGEL